MSGEREQAGPLEDWAVDELIDACRSLAMRLSDGQVRRIRRGADGGHTIWVAHVDRSQIRRILDVIEPEDGADA